jgi:hypothetical protein
LLFPEILVPLIQPKKIPEKNLALSSFPFIVRFFYKKLMNKQFSLRAIMMIALVSTIIGIGATPILLRQSAYSFRGGGDTTFSRAAAPIATSGDNVYIAWWTNKTGNNEVMFRASTDNGATFRDKINLSNSTNADSQDANIDASGDRVFVTWWDRNATSEEPLLRTSTDNGKTFGPIMKLSANGTIGSSSE